MVSGYSIDLRAEEGEEIFSSVLLLLLMLIILFFTCNFYKAYI